MILAALDSANHSLKLDIYRPMDPVEARGVVANYRRSTYNRGAFVEQTRPPSVVERFPDEEIDQHVQRAHQGCLRIMAGFIDKIRSQLDSNPNLATHVKNILLEYEHDVVWETLNMPTADFPENR